jgi:hypothetical protein
MAIDQRQGNKVVKSQRREDAPGTRVDPYPYIGIVKNNLDPTRCGRLQVWIPDLGGNQDDSKNWRTVSYASPFMGVTNISQKDANRAKNTGNKFTNTPNTYGFWAVPPDIGVEVLVMFIAGDPMRGYWFACVNSSVSRFMVPGIAASTHTDLSGASADVKNAYRPGNPAPVTEFNDNDPATYQKADFYNNPKPIHEPQYRVMINQGLDRDTVRGPISSSSQRETPSQVFGISTPGRPFPDAGVRDPENFLAKVAKGQLTEADYAYTTRQGGHSFIMDDGNITGRDQLIRLRTAQGHQIMMHDTENVLYINHADGTSWIEMTSTGAINVYSTNGVNVRSGGSINLHADSDINMNAGGKINMKAVGKFQLDAATVSVLSDSTLTVGAGGAIGLKAGGQFNVDAGPISLKAGGEIAMEGSAIKQNSGGTKAVTPPKPIQVNSFADTIKESTTGLWVPAGGLSSIVKVAPTHEPYNRGQQPPFTEPTALGIGPTAAYKDSVDKTKTAAGTAPQGATEADLRAQPKSTNKVGPLTTDQMTAYCAQTAKTASGGALGFDKTKFASEYAVVNTAGSVGKYQFSHQALKDLGYLTSDCSDNEQMTNSNKWKGKNGIDSLDAFLKTSAGQAEQETAIGEHTLRNYTAMCKSGAITKEMKPEEVAGMLSVSHQLGATGASLWRKGQGGADTNNDKYFQNGKYAVTILAPKLETIDQPKTT